MSGKKKIPRPALSIVDPLNPPAGDPLRDHAIAWWFSCKLHTTLSEPRVHELVTPEGLKLVLSVEEMLSPAKLRVAMLDVLGFFPPIPEKKSSNFLREVWEKLFATRNEIPIAREASDRGMLEMDIEDSLRGAPTTESGRELESGATLAAEDGTGRRYFRPRIFLDRVKRRSHVKFSSTDYHLALKRIGCEDLDVQRVGGWRGRVWLAPASIFVDSSGEQPEAATGIRATTPEVAPPAPTEPLASGTFPTVPEAPPTPRTLFDEDDNRGDAWLPEDDAP